MLSVFYILISHFSHFKGTYCKVIAVRLNIFALPFHFYLNPILHTQN